MELSCQLRLGGVGSSPVLWGSPPRRVAFRLPGLGCEQSYSPPSTALLGTPNHPGEWKSLGFGGCPLVHRGKNLTSCRGASKGGMQSIFGCNLKAG